MNAMKRSTTAVSMQTVKTQLEITLVNVLMASREMDTIVQARIAITTSFVRIRYCSNFSIIPS